MKSTSILGALGAILIIFAAGAAEAQHAAVHAPTSGAHYLNPQPLPPG